MDGQTEDSRLNADARLGALLRHHDPELAARLEALDRDLPPLAIITDGPPSDDLPSRVTLPRVP